MSDEMTLGERVRYYRDRRGWSRDVIAGLCGRSYEWLKKIENGERELTSLPLLIALTRALRLPDVQCITGGASVPVDSWGRTSHPGVPDLRRAVHAEMLGEVPAEPMTADELAGRVRQAWVVWHTSPTQRTDTAAVLPYLLRVAHATVRATDGADRRRAWAAMAEAYALAQQFAAHTTEPELYWVIVERARMAAELSDDPVSMAAAAWIIGNGLRVQGYTDEALRVVNSAAATLKPRLEDGPDLLRGTYGALRLHAAVTAAKDTRSGEAWQYHAEAGRVAQRLPAGYAHPWTMFGRGNVSVHGVSVAVDLHEPGAAERHFDDADVDAIPSTERRSRLYLDAAQAEAARREWAGAITYLSTAVRTSPEAVRYVPSGRALARTLATATRGPLKVLATSLAAEIDPEPVAA